MLKKVVSVVTSHVFLTFESLEANVIGRKRNDKTAFFFFLAMNCSSRQDGIY